jgi:hypothetical protein
LNPTDLAVSPRGDRDDGLGSQDTCQKEGCARPFAPSSVQHQSGITQRLSRKRKNDYNNGRRTKRLQIGAGDSGEAVLGDRGRLPSQPVDLQSGSDQDHSDSQHTEGRDADHDESGQSDVEHVGQDGRPSLTAVTPPAPPQTIVRRGSSLGASDPLELPEGRGDEYAELPADLRAKLRRIADTRTLRAV